MQCSSGGGSSMAVESRRARLVVVGDVHGNWHPQQDLAALQILQPGVLGHAFLLLFSLKLLCGWPILPGCSGVIVGGRLLRLVVWSDPS